MPMHRKGYHKRKRAPSRPAELDAEDGAGGAESGVSRKKVRWENDAEVSGEPSSSTEDDTDVIEKVSESPPYPR